MANPYKGYGIIPGDIVTIAVGRGWRQAKVIAKSTAGLLKVKFRNGRETEVQPDAVMTEEEAKAFRRSGGATKVVRKNNSNPLTGITGENSDAAGHKGILE